MDLARLRSAGAVITAAPALEPELAELRARFCPAYARELERRYAIESGAQSPYGPASASPDRRGGGSDAYASCGDCGARRTMSGSPCRACGSDQPPMISGVPTYLMRHYDRPMRG